MTSSKRIHSVLRNSVLWFASNGYATVKVFFCFYHHFNITNWSPLLIGFYFYYEKRFHSFLHFGRGGGIQICIWFLIANCNHRVNSVSTNIRTVDEVRKKWGDIASSTKKKEATFQKERAKTGGGPAPVSTNSSEISKKVKEINSLVSVNTRIH